MNRHPIMAELLADDLLLERLSTRMEAGSDPVVPLLAALARHADLPLRSVPAPRRFARRRALTALTALVVGASGVGVAAAVTGPDFSWPRQAHLVPDPEVRPKASPAAPRPVPAADPQGPVAATGGYVLVQEVTRRIAVAPPRVTVIGAPPAAAGAGPALVAPPAADEAPTKGEAKQQEQDERDLPSRAPTADDTATAKPSRDADVDDKGGPRRHVDRPGSDTVLALGALAPAPTGWGPWADPRSHGGKSLDPGIEDGGAADHTRRVLSADEPKGRARATKEGSAAPPAPSADPQSAPSASRPARPASRPAATPATRTDDLPVPAQAPRVHAPELPGIAGGALVPDVPAVAVTAATLPPA